MLQLLCLVIKTDLPPFGTGSPEDCSLRGHKMAPVPPRAVFFQETSRLISSGKRSPEFPSDGAVSDLKCPKLNTRAKMVRFHWLT